MSRPASIEIKMTQEPTPKAKKTYSKSVTSFEGFLHQLKTNHEPYQDVQCDGFAHFLKYDLGNLNQLAKDNVVVDDAPQDISCCMVSETGEAKALVNGKEVQVYTKENGKPVKVYAEKGPDGVSYTTVPPQEGTEDEVPKKSEGEENKDGRQFVPFSIPEYKPTKEDYMQVINQVRTEVKRKIIYPISKASGYKWEYSKGHFKDEILLLEFYCFQDITKDIQPGKFANGNLVSTFELCPCYSSVNVFINIITRQIRITYRHNSHTKLIDIIYTLLSQIYNE